MSLKRNPENKTVNQLERYEKKNNKKIRIPAKSDGNATLGQRSFMTSSKT